MRPMNDLQSDIWLFRGTPNKPLEIIINQALNRIVASKITTKQAKEGLEAIGMWMDTRYNSRFVGTPIQTWDMPPKENGFFTVYAMNLMLESDGFDSLAHQKPQDVKAFVNLLQSLGAPKTATFVRQTLAALKSKTRDKKNEATSNYYDLFKSEKVWVKLLDYVGRDIYVSYVLRAQAIEEAGGILLDPDQWQGELPKA